MEVFQHLPIPGPGLCQAGGSSAAPLGPPSHSTGLQVTFSMQLLLGFGTKKKPYSLEAFKIPKTGERGSQEFVSEQPQVLTVTSIMNFYFFNFQVPLPEKYM